MVEELNAINLVVPYIGTWIETPNLYLRSRMDIVVPYIGTWIETADNTEEYQPPFVVPYIGTWIETRCCLCENARGNKSYLI